MNLKVVNNPSVGFKCHGVYVYYLYVALIHFTLEEQIQVSKFDTTNTFQK